MLKLCSSARRDRGGVPGVDWRPRLLAALGLVGLLATFTPAGASALLLGQSAPFDIELDNGGAGNLFLKGTVTFVDFDFTNEDTVTFQVAVASDSDSGLDSVQISVLDECTVAGGFNCPDGAGFAATPSFDVPGTNQTGGFSNIFWFGESAAGAQDGEIGAGQSGQAFFVSYTNAITLDPEATVLFMLGPSLGGEPDVNFEVPIVPEPSTVLLVATGLAGLAAGSRRARR